MVISMFDKRPEAFGVIAGFGICPKADFGTAVGIMINDTGLRFASVAQVLSALLHFLVVPNYDTRHPRHPAGSTPTKCRTFSVTLYKISGSTKPVERHCQYHNSLGKQQ